MDLSVPSGNLPSRAAVAAGLCLGLLVAAAFWVWPPSTARFQEIELEGPFARVGGAVFFAEVPVEWPNDNKGAEENSRLRLLEDGTPLGPGHASVSAMEARAGAYRHLRFGLWFTTSDHSDPNVNGRQYRVLYPRPLPKLLYLGAAILAHFFLSFAVWGCFQRTWPEGGPRLKALAVPAVQGLLLLGTLQLAAWAVVENELVAAGKVEEALFRRAFRPAASGLGEGVPEQLEYNFEPHPYLNYALNGRKVLEGSRLHDGLYRLRRRRPLRPREDVDLRILALGGSTTYDVALRDEKDTWVYQLEARLRQVYGEGVEVLNGGAGGYTLMENSVHYLTLLTHLEPDLVLLFTGHNDVHPRLFGTLAPDYSNYRRPWGSGEGTFPVPSRRLAPFYPYRLAYLLGTFRPALARSVNSAVTKARTGGAKTWPEALARNDAGIYRKTLETLVLLIQAQGREPVLLPQYFTPRAPTDEVFGAAVAQHNEVARQVAEARGVLFLGAILEPGAFDSLDTMDRCHFSDRGAGKMAALVGEGLIHSGLLEKVLGGRPGEARAGPENP